MLVQGLDATNQFQQLQRSVYKEDGGSLADHDSLTESEAMREGVEEEGHCDTKGSDRWT